MRIVVIPFLTAYYREIIVVDPRYYYDDIREVMKKNKNTVFCSCITVKHLCRITVSAGLSQNDKTEQVFKRSPVSVLEGRENRLIESGIVTVDGKTSAPGMKVRRQEVRVGGKKVVQKAKLKKRSWQ